MVKISRWPNIGSVVYLLASVKCRPLMQRSKCSRKKYKMYSFREKKDIGNMACAAREAVIVKIHTINERPNLQ